MHLDRYFVWVSAFEMHLNSVHIILDLLIIFSNAIVCAWCNIFERIWIFFYQTKIVKPEFTLNNSESILGLRCRPIDNVPNAHSIQTKFYSHLHLKCTEITLNAWFKQALRFWTGYATNSLRLRVRPFSSSVASFHVPFPSALPQPKEQRIHCFRLSV